MSDKPSVCRGDEKRISREESITPTIDKPSVCRGDEKRISREESITPTIDKPSVCRGDEKRISREESITPTIDKLKFVGHSLERRKTCHTKSCQSAAPKTT